MMKGIRCAWRSVEPEFAEISFFGRLVDAGACRYTELVDGTLSIQNVFDMHRMLDYREAEKFRQYEAMKQKQEARTANVRHK